MTLADALAEYTRQRFMRVMIPHICIFIKSRPANDNGAA
jgi:hypothetical protein